MAEEALKKLEEEVNCSICLGTYTDPKLLQCFHVYCQQCLVPLVDKYQRGIICPTCRQVTPVPFKGVAGLQPAAHINRLIDLQGSFQQLRVGAERGSSQVMAETALAQLNTHRREISNQQAVTKNSIQFTFRRLHEILGVRESELIAQVDQLTRAKLDNLTAQKHQIEADLGRFTGRFVSKPDTGGPNVTFFAADDLPVACRNYGQVITTATADPSKCCARAVHIEDVVYATSVFILQVFDSEDRSYEEPLNGLLECKIVSELTGARGICSVERRGLSHYEITYQPIVKGKHQLYLKVNGEHVRGTPCSMAVKSPNLELGTPLFTIGGLKGPCGIAINHKGEVVVAEADGPRISVFSYSGEKILSFSTGKFTAGQGLFPGSLGVAVDAEGNIIVADSVNCCLKKFTAEGELLAQSDKICGGPYDVAIYDHALLLVVHINSVHSYHSDTLHKVWYGNSVLPTTFGTGCNFRSMKSASGVTRDRSGYVYVTDTGNHCIRSKKSFGKHGHYKGDLDGPYGIAIDSNDMVYVSECGNHRVSVFTSEGQFVTSFGRKGVGPGEFNSPRGLAVDENGILYVCDYCNGRVQVF